jgi:hypothetical protein
MLHRSVVLLTLFTTVFVGNVVFPSPAEAAVESELVRAGVAAYDALEYARAIDLLSRALGETLTKEERIVTFRTRAFARVALDQPQQARGDFERLLRTDPTFQLDRTISPRVRAVFESAQAAVSMGRASSPDENRLPLIKPAIMPAQPREGRPVTFRVTYPGGIAQRMELFHRTRGDLRFSRVEAASANGHFEATVPGLQVRPQVLEWYVVLLDDTGASVANAGSLGQPLALDVQGKSRPVYTKAWFWGVLGGAVVAAAIVGGVVGSGAGAKISPDTPATLTIMPR